MPGGTLSGPGFRFDIHIQDCISIFTIGLFHIIMIYRDGPAAGRQDHIGTDHKSNGTQFGLDHLQAPSQSIVLMADIQFIDLPVQKDRSIPGPC